MTPLLERPTHRESLAMLIRVAGTWVPDPEESTGWRQIPAFRAHGAIRSLMVLDALWWFAADQETGTPRTGASTLAWLVAVVCGWKRLPAAQMIDSHGGTLRLHRERLQDAGLLLTDVAKDDWLQDRATDWLLRPAADDLTDEQLAAADRAIERYREKNPDAEAARTRSAARLAARWRAFRARLAGPQKLEPQSEKNESAPLPTGLAEGQAVGITSTDHCFRAPAGTREASPEGLTRSPGTEQQAKAPRTCADQGLVTEGDGAAASPKRWRRSAAEVMDDARSGRRVAVKVSLALPAGLRSESGLSDRAAAKMGALARLSRARLGWDLDQTAAALARLMQTRGVRLSVAAAEFRHDLRHRVAVDPQKAARAEARRREEAAALAALPLPAFVRVDERGRPLVWARDASRPGPRWICCHRLPSLDELNDPTVRRQITAAAYAAGITGAQQFEREATSGRLAQVLEHHADPAGYMRSIRGNGCTLLIGLDNTRATVPPEHSTAAAIRWSAGEPEPTEEQTLIYRRLARRRFATERPVPAPGRTARAMFSVIASMLSEDEHDRGAAVERGRAILADHGGDAAAALFAAHPANGGTDADFNAVLSAL